MPIFGSYRFFLRRRVKKSVTTENRQKVTDIITCLVSNEIHNIEKGILLMKMSERRIVNRQLRNFEVEKVISKSPTKKGDYPQIFVLKFEIIGYFEINRESLFAD